MCQHGVDASTEEFTHRRRVKRGGRFVYEDVAMQRLKLIRKYVNYTGDELAPPQLQRNFFFFFFFCGNFLSSISFPFCLCLYTIRRRIIYNHTFPEYLISTLPHPRRMYRHTHRPRKQKIAPKQPLLLSPVVRLITPPPHPCYPPWIHSSTTNKTLNSNFGERGVGYLARCFFFILNFMF